ncbi:hypothetical protein K474DRAFT_1704214 [Panus rudis PR-1116 ss-1]|nr:hypothetical protein K474DRAFT_1704214 [Panus rudis PR-1116 ss-1]
MSDPSPSNAAAEIELLIDVIKVNRIAGYLQVSMVAFMAYDILLNLRREIEHIWLFSAGPTLFTSVINVILVLRIHALYRASVRLLVALVLLLIAELSLNLYTAVKVMRTEHLGVPPPGIPFQGCLFETAQNTLTSWIPGLIVATTMFALTIFKFFRLIHEGASISWRDIDSKGVLFLFFRDGTVYFMLIFAIVLVSMLCDIVDSLTIAASDVAPLLVVVYSHAGTRLILNLRSASQDEPLSFLTSVETISFRSACDDISDGWNTNEDVDHVQYNSQVHSRNSRHEVGGISTGSRAV